MVKGASYLTGRRLHAARLWLSAIVISVLLNLGLFGLMPDLVRQPVDQLDRITPVRPVNIVRLTPPKPPEPKKERPTPSREEKVERRIDVTKPVPRSQQARPQPLKFDFKPQLPDIPTALPMLPIASVAFDSEPLPEIAPPPAIPLKEYYGMDEIDGPLVPVSLVPPVYPLRARRKGIEGRVKVKFLVTEKGKVEQITFLSAEPKNLFEKNVLKAVSTWRFKPGTVDGKVVKTWVLKTLEFKLQ